MKDYRLFRQDGGSGNVPPPPPPPPSTPPPPPPPPPTGGSPTETKEGASTNAIIALILGILSWIACGIIAAIPAWIMGKKEVNAIDAGQSSQAGRTMANIGMWLGIIQVILTIIALIVVVLLLLFGIISDL
jgi:hypothetical protein